MRDPDIAGSAAALWLCGEDDPGKMRASLGAYLVCAPQAHPFWSWHVLSIIHLRETPELGPANRVDFPGATHEVLSVALSPDYDAGLDPDDISTWVMLRPEDVVHQVMLADDEQASELLGLAAKAVAEGMLIPDSDWQTTWERILNRTCEHIRLGDHPDA